MDHNTSLIIQEPKTTKRTQQCQHCHAHSHATARARKLFTRAVQCPATSNRFSALEDNQSSAKKDAPTPSQSATQLTKEPSQGGDIPAQDSDYSDYEESDSASTDDMSLVSGSEINGLEEDLKDFEDDGYDTETTDNTSPSHKRQKLPPRQSRTTAQTRISEIFAMTDTSHAHEASLPHQPANKSSPHPSLNTTPNSEGHGAPTSANMSCTSPQGQGLSSHASRLSTQLHHLNNDKSTASPSSQTLAPAKTPQPPGSSLSKLHKKFIQFSHHPSIAKLRKYSTMKSRISPIVQQLAGTPLKKVLPTDSKQPVPRSSITTLKSGTSQKNTARIAFSEPCRISAAHTQLASPVYTSSSPPQRDRLVSHHNPPPRSEVSYSEQTTYQAPLSITRLGNRDAPCNGSTSQSPPSNNRVQTSLRPKGVQPATYANELHKKQHGKINDTGPRRLRQPISKSIPLQVSSRKQTHPINRLTSPSTSQTAAGSIGHSYATKHETHFRFAFSITTECNYLPWV